MQHRFTVFIGIFGALCALLIAGPLTLSQATVTAVPIFTGDALADFSGPDVIRLDDPSSGIGIPDVGLPIAFPEDRISGWEMNAMFLEYDIPSDTMYVGIDCMGICGDADGNGDPGGTGPILADLQGTDRADFSGTESFTLLIDTDGDCGAGDTGGYNVVVGVALGSDINAFGAYEFVGSPFSPSTGFGTVISNTVTLFANPVDATPDLEFSISDFSTLPGFNFTPGNAFAFSVNAFMGSLDDDGIGEDYLPGAGACLPVEPPPATPTPTHTPTETPVPPTPTDTPVPPPTPTDTPTPPPPSVPPVTGPSLDSARAQANLDTPIMGLDRAFAPERLSIPAIDLDAVVEPMGWFSVMSSAGEAISEWQVVDDAVGWHANSALPSAEGNVILSGHNSIGGSVFEGLHLVKAGDIVTIQQDDQAHWYQVTQAVIVPERYADAEQRAHNAAYMDEYGDDRLTLITCWPAFSDTHRVIVVAHKVVINNRNIY